MAGFLKSLLFGGLVLPVVVALPGETGETGRPVFCKGDPPSICLAGQGTHNPRLTCEAVMSSLGLLRACGMELLAPLSIEITNTPFSDDPRCIGAFYSNTNHITLLSPWALYQVLGGDHPLRSIPQNTLFSSLVTHEMAHALLYQSRGGPGSTVMEDEYVAYAMQYWSLPAKDRQTLLQSGPSVGSVAGFEMMNDVVLALSPELFGSMAWKHFDSTDGGCGFVSEIVSGRVGFRSARPPYANTGAQGVSE